MYNLLMIKRLTSEEFWCCIEEAKGKKTMTWLASESKVPLSVLTSTKHRRSFLSFNNTVSVCNALGIDMNCFSQVHSWDNDVLIEKLEIDSIDFGISFWKMLEHVRLEKHWSWRYISGVSNVPATTISTAKLAKRLLPFDITMALLDGMKLSPNKVAYKLLFKDLECIPCPVYEESIEIYRSKLNRYVKELDDGDVLAVLDYVEYLRARKK